MGRDCLWDSEEQDWEWTVQLICSSLSYGTRLPLGQRGAKPLCCSSLSQRQFCPILNRGADQLGRTSTSSSSLFQTLFCPILNRGADQLCSLSSVLLLAVPEAVSSHTKARSRSAVQSILCVAPRCPRGSLVPYKSEEHQFCGALLTERTVLLGCLGTWWLY